MSSLSGNQQSAPFSERLREWSADKRPKTLGDLYVEFAEKSFALFFLVLMTIPALPLPTGGVTHVFEIINMLLALEMIAGVRKAWLPNFWLRRPLGKNLQHRGLPKLMQYAQRIEKFSRPRLSSWFHNREFLRLIGLLVLVLTIAAFIAPPFTGLDTLPSLGVVLVAFALIFDDIVLLLAGVLSGLIGVGLIVGLSTIVYRLF